jgi:hypothetical protein
VATVIEARRAAASAPTNDPALMTEKSSVNVVRVPWRSRSVNTGKIVWKLYESVPTTAIITSGANSSGVRRTYASPSRICPRPRGATGGRRSSDVRIAQSAARTARYDSASPRNAQP